LQSYLEKLLCELISINSSNPDYSDISPGEHEIGQFIYDLFRKNNIDSIKQEVELKRSNIIAKVSSNPQYSSNKKKQAILLCSHLDTVFIDGMRFAPELKNGFIYGPGSCDTKSSLAVMIAALIEYSKLAKRSYDAFFLGAVSEESRHLGIRKFIEEYKDITSGIDLCIIGEPTSLDLGIAHKGSLKFTIRTEGKSAHGSTPQMGVNAINMMSDIISNINSELIPLYDNLADEILGKATLNIGVIKGGRAFNIVPDFCSIELDRRVLPSETIDDVLKGFKDVIHKTAKGRADFIASVDKVNDYIPFLKTDISSLEFIRLLKSCRKIYPGSKQAGLPYATDGGFTCQAGIQTVVFGPGDIKNCHTLEEYVSTNELFTAFEIIKNYLLQIG